MQTDTAIRKWTAAKNQELHRCGDGLYIRGFLSGRKLFQVRISLNQRRRWIDIGEYPKKSLANAREIALAVKRVLKSGEVQNDKLQAAILRASSAGELDAELNKGVDSSAGRLGIPIFEQAFREWYGLQLKANTWRHKASARFPITAYELHVHKHIGNVRLDKIKRPMIKQFMQPLFLSNSETARKLLGYIHKVFETAYDNELIDSNPCPRKDSFTIPKRKVQHSSSLHYSRLPELWIWLNEAPFSETVKMAMRLSIVTTHRAAVIANMRWEHFDCNTEIWSIPEAPVGLSEGFMKSGRQFAVKLPQVLSKTLCALPKRCEFVFSVNGNSQINAETLRRNFQKFDNITTHGFRNTFKTWCLDNSIDDFLADRYCDHALKGLDKSYRRDDLFQKRAELAERYYDFCNGFEWFVRRTRGAP